MRIAGFLAGREARVDKWPTPSRRFAPRSAGSSAGRAWAKGDVYKILANRVYLGQAVHKGVAYPGEHAAIVDQELWDRAHGVMAEPTRQRAATSRAQCRCCSRA